MHCALRECDCALTTTKEEDMSENVWFEIRGEELLLMATSLMAREALINRRVNIGAQAFNFPALSALKHRRFTVKWSR